MAYTIGQAAKRAPPAVMNHTWLPSQVGPMAFNTTRRCASVRPTKGSSVPTPRSKPPSKANPISSTPTKSHQISFSVS